MPSDNHPTNVYNPLEIIARDVINIMSDIIEVIEAEHVALHKPKIEDYQSIVAIKISLGEMYEQRVKDLLAHPDFPTKISKETFEQLQAISLKHYKAIATNEKRLSLLIRVTFEILQTIVNQVKNVSGHVKSYTKKGKSILNKSSVAVALDRTL